MMQTRPAATAHLAPAGTLPRVLMLSYFATQDADHRPYFTAPERITTTARRRQG